MADLLVTCTWMMVFDRNPSDGPTGYDGCQRGKSQLMLDMSVEPYAIRAKNPLEIECTSHCQWYNLAVQVLMWFCFALRVSHCLC